MIRNLKIALWVSCLALTGLLASCGSQNIGTDVQPQQSASGLPADSTGVLPVQIAPQGDERGVSFTPGLPLHILAGLTTPSIGGYGWKGGSVTESPFASGVTLSTSVGAIPLPKAWIAYDFRETVAGRLQTIKITGSGQGLQGYMYNWAANNWIFLGAINLSGGPVTIVVPAAAATNGDTYLMLEQDKVGKSTITQIKTNVF